MFFVFKTMDYSAKKLWDNNQHIPFILRYFYRDIKSVYGSVTNVSAICKKCSRTFQGSIHSPHVFESHLKSPKGHHGLYEEYLKIRPQPSVETINDTNDRGKQSVHSDRDGPIIKLFKSLITNDYKEKTVLSNAHIIDILEKEFFMDVKNTHELEVEIYMNVLKKYLKDWPDWDDFEQAAIDINLDDSALAELLHESHIKLKDYLCGILDIAKHLAIDVTKKIPNLKEDVVLDESVKDSEVVMEITATKAQLNNLIMRYPKNNNIFNIKEPDIDGRPQAMSLDSILNSCGISIEIRLKNPRSEMLVIKYENKHTISHNLINGKLKTKSQVAKLNQAWQVKYKKKKSMGDLFKDTIPNILCSHGLKGDKVKWKKLFISMHRILNNVMESMPVRIDSKAVYKRYLSSYSFVRYFYNDCEDNQPVNDKYDIMLEETISPMCLLSISYYPKEQNEAVIVHCDICTATFSGLNVLKNIEDHVANCHDVEPDWTCMNCNQTINVAGLTEMNWQHKCPNIGPVASSSIQTTLNV